MVFAFDTLGYSKRLRAAGIPDGHADAHAEAAREFIMTELAIKSDLLATKSELKSDIAGLKSDMAELKAELKSDMAVLKAELKSDMAELRTELKSDMAGLRTEFRSDMAGLKNVVALKSDLTAIETSVLTLRTELLAAIEKSALQTAIRLGGMVIAGVGVLAASIGVLAFVLRAH